MSALRKSATRYLVVIEKGQTSYGAYVPELPGCVAVGRSRLEVKRLIKEAIRFHLDDVDPVAKRAVSNAWRAEVTKRRVALRAGVVKPVSWSDARARLEAL